MRAAAAVLGASLLFFLGVLTGAGRRESLPPPVAIPLGVVAESASDGAGPPSSPDRPGISGTTDGPERPPTTDPSAPPTATDPSAPASPPAAEATGGSGGGGPTATPAPTAPAPTPTSTVRPGRVEKVDSEVDCSRNPRGQGRGEPCPPAPPTAERDGDRSGGGPNR